MTSRNLSAIAAPLRTYGPVVFEGYEEPHVELMTLVWGPVFDRDHAFRLLERRPGYVAQVLRAVWQAADQFDSLDGAQQQRLRMLILRHQSRWENARNPH